MLAAAGRRLDAYTARGGEGMQRDEFENGGWKIEDGAAI